MALSSRERSQRRREKQKRMELIPVQTLLPFRIHSVLKKKAAAQGKTLRDFIEGILTRSARQ